MMDTQHIKSFILRFLAVYECEIIDQTSSSVTCKLSPGADKLLTNRPYYWNFIERMSIHPETLTYTFVFDSSTPNQEEAQHTHRSMNSIQADVSFGSAKLQQMFDIVKRAGRFVQLFETPPELTNAPLTDRKLESWLGLIVKLEYLCDRKRSELYTYGVHLEHGTIREPFYCYVQSRTLTAKVPHGICLPPAKLSMLEALEKIEGLLEDKIKSEDQTWSHVAYQRWQTELAQIDSYFEHMLNSQQEANTVQIAGQYDKCQSELARQYKPRICMSVVHAGLYHLYSTTSTTTGYQPST